MYDSCDPSKYLVLSESLSGSSEQEAVRTAGDRAYYSAFLYSRDRLAAKGHIVPYYDSRDHQYVSQQLKRMLGSAGNDENMLRIHRNRLTYDTRALSGCPGPDWMIHTAKSIMDKVRALP